MNSGQSSIQAANKLKKPRPPLLIAIHWMLWFGYDMVRYLIFMVDWDATMMIRQQYHMYDTILKVREM